MRENDTVIRKKLYICSEKGESDADIKHLFSTLLPHSHPSHLLKRPILKGKRKLWG